MYAKFSQDIAPNIIHRPRTQSIQLRKSRTGNSEMDFFSFSEREKKTDLQRMKFTGREEFRNKTHISCSSNSS
jgi:hypothetical protein